MGKIVLGDCLEELAKFETNSVDFVCTDPPYGYSFMGKNWDRAVPTAWLWAECLRVLKPGAFMCVMSAPRSDVLSRMIVNIEDAGFRVDFSPLAWTFASGFPKASNTTKILSKRGIDKPELEGSYLGWQPKPAWECVIVAMKPLSEKSYVDQALKNGRGVSWLDDGRIPIGSEETSEGINKSSGISGGMFGTGKATTTETRGRFPANLLVSDDVLNDGRERKVGGIGASIDSDGKKDMYAGGQHNTGYSDNGSYSRYFDLDKWASTLPFLIVPKASKSEKNKGLDSFDTQEPNYTKTYRPTAKESGDKGQDTPYAGTNRGGKMKNGHPTVKPLKLMSYLITLFTRTGDVVLDPFMGSGTTCLAAKKLKRDYIGIEREPEYIEIAEARLEDDKQEVLL